MAKNHLSTLTVDFLQVYEDTCEGKLWKTSRLISQVMIVDSWYSSEPQVSN